MEVFGKVKQIGNTKVVSDKFKNRELIITTDEQYPQHLSIEFIQDKCDLLDKIKVGDNVKVAINLRGREWTNPQGEVRYFNSLQGWFISQESGTKTQAAPQAAEIEIDGGDLPF
jgi:hypothetical protein